jgi:hypothetical protein
MVSKEAWHGAIGIFLVFAFIVSVMLAYPYYRIYEQERFGQAALAEAEYTKKILVEDAKARLESSKLDALAEIERAKGVAEANKIIGTSLANNEAYLRYLWIQGLHDGSSEVIYVPTEANLPILEAGNRALVSRE